MRPQEDPTPEEVEQLRQDAALEEDEQRRKANIAEAARRGWHYEPGIGWIDQDGTVMLDDIGREM